MMVDKDKLAIIRAILSLAKALGMKTTAEGIGMRVAGALRDMGCNFGQGYYFARPMALRTTPMAWNAGKDSTRASGDPLDRLAGEAGSDPVLPYVTEQARDHGACLTQRRNPCRRSRIPALASRAPRRFLRRACRGPAATGRSLSVPCGRPVPGRCHGAEPASAAAIRLRALFEQAAPHWSPVVASGGSSTASRSSDEAAAQPASFSRPISRSESLQPAGHVDLGQHTGFRIPPSIIRRDPCWVRKVGFSSSSAIRTRGAIRLLY